ncbi:MAG: hypothetical protein WA003_09445 [Desulfuromonadaceae bacterium]
MKNRFPVKTLLLVGLLAILALPLTSHQPLSAFASADSPLSAGEEWKKELKELSATTQDAMTLTPDELRSLIARCEALRPVIEKLEEHSRKVYLKRLEMAKKMYLFALESKKSQPL